MSGDFRIVHPVVEPTERAAVARASARSRISLRRIFRDDPRAQAAFADIRPDQCAAAFVDDRVAGLLLIRRAGADPFGASLSGFQAVWGVVGGTWRYVAYDVVQRIGDDGGAYIVAFWVARDHRRRGVGDALLRRILDSVSGPVTALARPRSVPVYARCGFREETGLRARILRRLTGTIPMRRPG